MRVSLAGVGALGPGFDDWAELREQLCSNEVSDVEMTSPKPAVIPPRERRRAPLLVRVAVDVAAQACDAAGVDAKDVASVFASGMGDMTITDYMCRTLATDDKMLSPTRFHNSVHNAAAGYWSISTKCHEPANSISGFRLTATSGLLEAAAQCAFEKRPVLLVAFDVPGPSPIDAMNHIDAPFGAALVLTPDAGTHKLEMSVQPGNGDWPALAGSRLQGLYDSNPAARLLALLQTLDDDPTADVALPLGPDCSLLVSTRRAA
ncbi:MAG: beta-ketoacyl synthase chain length factor [Gammaproteobacteria bacterium]